MRFESRRLQWLAYLFLDFYCVLFFLLYGRKQSYSLLTSIQFMEMESKQKHKFDTVCHCGFTTYWSVCGVLLILIHYLHMYFRFSHNSFIILDEVLFSSVNSESNLFMQLVVCCFCLQRILSSNSFHVVLIYHKVVRKGTVLLFKPRASFPNISRLVCRVRSVFILLFL